MLISQNHQIDFSGLAFSEFIYKKEHPLLKLNEAIAWDNLLEYLGQFYSPHRGRPTIPLRAKVGTEILKRLKHLPDREAVHYVEENIYAQQFCELTPAAATGYMNPHNGLANFRKQIGRQGLTFLNEVLLAAATKKPFKKGNKLIIDTTCVPMDIRYPTDISLLERCRQEIIQLIKKAKKYGFKLTYRTYNRTARKVFVQFSKLRRPKEKTRKKVHKQMLQFLRRNFKQLADLRPKATQKLAPQVKHSSKVLTFLRQLKNAENKIRIILWQQKQIHSGSLHINQRIVSFHKDHIRPIVRGKFPVDTEFGPKILLAIVKGYTYVINAFADNVADSTLVLPALRWFKQTFGRFPDKILGDRGLFSRRIHLWLKSISITSGLQPRGKASLLSKTEYRLMHRQRLPIEARISLAKRKFGWNRCRAKNIDHESAWINLAASAMNLHLAFFCRSP